MATLAEIMDALATQIRDTFDDVTDVAVQVEPRMLISPSGSATVDMYPAEPSTDPTLAGFGDLDGAELLTLRARVSPTDRVGGQDLLLALMDDEDPLSLVAAINDDPTLGGLAADVDVRSRSGYTLFPDAAGEGALLGCLWGVVVLKAHS